MKHLPQQLVQLSCFKHIKQICPVDSGLSMQSYKVQTAQGLYFAKFIDESINSTVESLCSVVAAEQGLAPEVYYYDAQWLVVNFIQGEELTTSSLCLNDKLHIAIDLMYKFHQLSIDLPCLNIEKTIKGLLLPNYYQSAQIALIKQIAQHLTLTIQVNPSYVCHGDINFTNVLYQNLDKKAYLVDFECACLADIEFDIAMLLAINNPDKAYHDAVIHFYEQRSAADSKVKINKKLVTRYLGFSYLINALWFYNKFKQNNKNYFYQQAIKQFTLFDGLEIIDSQLAKQMG
jgi:thiamine kinase-like enzyme